VQMHICSDPGMAVRKLQVFACFSEIWFGSWTGLRSWVVAGCFGLGQYWVKKGSVSIRLCTGLLDEVLKKIMMIMIMAMIIMRNNEGGTYQRSWKYTPKLV
jgi:hypothetical protein